MYVCACCVKPQNARQTFFSLSYIYPTKVLISCESKGRRREWSSVVWLMAKVVGSVAAPERKEQKHQESNSLRQESHYVAHSGLQFVAFLQPLSPEC